MIRNPTAMEWVGGSHISYVMNNGESEIHFQLVDDQVARLVGNARNLLNALEYMLELDELGEIQGLDAVGHAKDVVEWATGKEWECPKPLKEDDGNEEE